MASCVSLQNESTLCCDSLPKWTKWCYLPCFDYQLCSARTGFPKAFKKNFSWPSLVGQDRSFFGNLWTLTPSLSVNMQKTNLANIQTKKAWRQLILNFVFVVIIVHSIGSECNLGSNCSSNFKIGHIHKDSLCWILCRQIPRKFS